VEIAREPPAWLGVERVIVNVDGRWLDPDAR